MPFAVKGRLHRGYEVSELTLKGPRVLDAYRARVGNHSVSYQSKFHEQVTSAWNIILGRSLKEHKPKNKKMAKDYESYLQVELLKIVSRMEKDFATNNYTRELNETFLSQHRLMAMALFYASPRAFTESEFFYKYYQQFGAKELSLLS